MTATQQKTVRRKAVKATPTHAGELSSLPIHRSMGNGALSEYLFSKYKVSDPSDSAEIAAERAADKVMAGGKVDAGAPAGGEQTVFRSEEGGSAPEPGGSGSTGLPGPVQEKMEGAFGRSLGGVRVHHDEKADTLSRGFHATAFTQGSDIYFRKGAYNPGSQKGQHLIAHEVDHALTADGMNVYREIWEPDKLCALLEDDPVFRAFIDAIIKTPNLLKKIAADDTYKTVAAAANAAAGASGVGGAMARVAYGKDTSTKIAGLAETAGALATETGSTYGNIAGSAGNKDYSNKYKSNAKAITAAGHGMNFISDTINFGAGLSKRNKAGKELVKINSGDSRRKEEAKTSIARAKKELLNMVARDRKISPLIDKLNEIGPELNSKKIEQAQERMSSLIETYKNDSQWADCIEALKSARRTLRMQVTTKDRGLSKERKAFLEDQKTSGFDGAMKAMGLGIGHGLSGIGAALESYASSFGKTVNGGFAIAGGILSTLGGITSSVTGAFSSVTKAKRAVKAQKNASAAELYGQQLINDLSSSVGEKAPVDLDYSKENGLANCIPIYNAYFAWMSEGIDVGAFTEKYNANNAVEAKEVIMKNYVA